MLSWTTAYIAAEWVIRIAMLVYVPQRRTPAAARTWLLLVFFWPVVGLVVYWVFGRIYYPQRRIEEQARASRYVREAQAEMRAERSIAPPPLDPLAARSAETTRVRSTGSSPTSTGHATTSTSSPTSSRTTRPAGAWPTRSSAPRSVASPPACSPTRWDRSVAWRASARACARRASR
jgi:hypothetical protein